MTVQTEIASANAVLTKDGIENAPQDTRLLMASALGIDAGRVTLHLREEVSPKQQAVFWSHIQRRLDREPVSHIVGARLFYGRRFTVTADVLDPRPETETLIEAALSVPFDRVLDLGTGSGCILLTLLAERETAKGVGVDVSGLALQTARDNSLAYELVRRAGFLESDWFAIVDGQYDLIVSNPPYIAAAEMDGLAPELSYEPRMALTDEGDGLSCYRIITAGAPQHLNAGGWLMVEIGPSQGASVMAMFTDAGLSNVEIRPDLDGRDRVVMGQKPL